MAPVKAVNRSKAQDATARKPSSSDPSAGNTHSPQSPTGVTKVPKRRRQKTHSKVLGPLDTDYGSHSNTASPLLALPFEVRRIIWRHALTSPNKRIFYNTNSSKLNLSPIGAAIFATCHQIALETMGIPLKLNKLCFDVQGFFKCQRRLIAMEGVVEWELMSNWTTDMFGHGVH